MIDKLLITLFLSSMLFSLQAKIIIQEASYTMGDDDSKADTRNRAILKAKRDALERSGVYIKSNTTFKNGNLDDTIQSFSASIMKVTLLDSKFDYPNYWVKIKADINVELLNKKLKSYSTSEVDDSTLIDAKRSEIEALNKKLDKILHQKHKKNELKNLQLQKKSLIQKINTLADNKSIKLSTIKDKNYAYITITSNKKETEIYIDNIYVGMAPIKRFKIPSNKEIVIKGVNDKRYFPKDIIIRKKAKRLSIPKVNLNFTTGKSEIFLVGESGAKVYVNSTFLRVLSEENRVLEINSDKKVEIAIVHYDGCYTTQEDLWANNTYEIFYTLSKSICSKIDTTIKHHGISYETVISPYTGKIWLDRNLGASQVCQRFDDKACYGDLYQWGRETDSHQKRSSSQSNEQARSLSNSKNKFITTQSSNKYDWAYNIDRNGNQRTVNWSKTDGSSICPKSFRVPSIKELQKETINNNFKDRNDAFKNFLKLPSSGYRDFSSGSLDNVGTSGYVWSSSVSGSSSNYLYFGSGNANAGNGSRAYGVAVRCVKD
jgi:hypothetical protein